MSLRFNGLMKAQWPDLTGACAPEPATELLLSLLFLLLLLLFSLRCFGCFCCFRCCLCFVSCCFVSPRRPTTEANTAPQMIKQRCQNGANMVPKMSPGTPQGAIKNENKNKAKNR